MTRKEIAKKLVAVLPAEILKRDSQLSFGFASPAQVGVNKADEYVKTVIDIVKTIITDGESVEISGFGKFIIRRKNERIGRNPQTKEDAVISARKVVSFKPSRLLKNTVNQDSGGAVTCPNIIPQQ